MTLSTEDERWLEQGRRLLEEDRGPAALEHFRAAYAREPGDARICSYYGLCLGLVERRYEESLSLCDQALKREFFNPELYLNLARVHLCFGFKVEAIRYLRRGQMIDPANDEIRLKLQQLGPRRRQVLAFLPRGHLLNRCLGRVCHWLGIAPRRQMTA